MCNDFWKNWRPGILVKDQLKELKKFGIITGPKKDIGLSSLDLHLSDTGWEMNGSVKLIKDNESFSEIIKQDIYHKRTINLLKPCLLEPKNTYVIELQEQIKNDIKELELYGIATGKSSIGRLDVLTRLIVDGVQKYDCLPKDKSGRIFVEVTPITFPIIVRKGDVLNQLRLFRGSPEENKLSENEVKLFGTLIESGRENKDELSINLDPDEKSGKNVIAFTTKKSRFQKNKAIDLRKKKHYSSKSYWKPVYKNNEDYIQIKRDHFYILRSKQRFKLPPDIGVYCKAITEDLGEIRIHYAGFVHPGFGTDRKDDKIGTPLIFEVRGHTVNAFLRDDELLANVAFYRTSKPVTEKGQSYNEQELKLSVYFK